MQLRNISDDEIDALETASFGTIGRTIEERHHFWKEVEKLERDPRGDKVKLAIDHDQKFWDLALANRKTAPEPLRTQLESKRNDPAPDSVVLNQVATPKAFAIYKWAIGLDQDFPIEIEPGRGGRIQNRIIAELPHELEPHERVRIVRDFTSKLTEKGLPFWAVIHAPDENNDKRNFHVHIVYYDRPAAKMADPKDPTKLVWDFEIVEQKRFENRHVREIRPFIQDKDTGAKINAGNARPDAANPRHQAAVLKPSAETPAPRAPSQSTNRPAEQKPPAQAAKPAPATPAATSPSRTAQEPKPQPKGSFTIPENPARTTPSRVPGFVVEGAKPKPRTSGHELTPGSNAHPVEKKSAEPSKPAPSNPKQMQLPIANVPVPKRMARPVCKGVVLLA